MQKLKMGMVGGGEGAFIGGVHRYAARLDGKIDLVCGAFSSTPEKAKASGAALGIAPARTYADYETMMQAEAALPESERMDFVVIVTPNHMHLPVAKTALEYGFHVLSDKPATRNLAEAKDLQAAVAASGCLYGLTHNYTGYPLVKHARKLVADGALGTLRKVVVEYLQGWLYAPLPDDHKQAAWRADPEQAGLGGCVGDIGSHAANLSEYITGQNIVRLNSDLTRFVDGRRVDDDGVALLEFSGGAKGILNASQIAVGEQNGLSIRLYGDKAGLEWRQEEPNTLVIKNADNSRSLVHAGNELSDIEGKNTRTPGGHPEGFLEAFANIYSNFADAVLAHKTGGNVASDYPGIAAAVHGMAVIEGLVMGDGQGWTDIKD